MATLIKHKKVELTELFYDLVYVYGISKMTSLIHHIHHGGLSWSNFLAFAVGMIIMINSWMIQTVFTNRFGKNSLTNIAFMFAQMSLLLISLTSVTGNYGSRESFIYFYLPFTLISLVLLGQYALEYYRSTDLVDRSLIKRFFYILGLRSLGLLISLFLPLNLGLTVAVISVLGTWILPGLITGRRTQVADEVANLTSFPHLAERLSLLVIITFGEAIIGIADYFSAGHLSPLSFLVFTVIASLFMIYIVEIDHMLDIETDDKEVNALIYWHYPIFFGISFLNVSLAYLANQEVENSFAVLMAYLGVFLVTLGIFGCQRFNKESHKFTSHLALGMFLPILFGFAASWLVLGQSQLLIAILFLVTLVMSIVFIRFNLSRLADTNS